MKSIDWIEKIKKHEGKCSDYRAAQLLDMSRQAISGHRRGRRKYLEDESAIKTAEILGINPIIVLTDQHAERQKNPEAKKIWEKMGQLAKKANIATIVAVIAISTGQYNVGNENSVKIGTTKSILCKIGGIIMSNL